MGVIALLIVLGVAVVVAVTRSEDEGDAPRVTDRQRAEAWSADAEAAYEPLGDTALRLPVHVREWLAGTRPTEQLRADVDEALAATTEVRDRVAVLRPFPLDPRVNPLYRSSTDLYVAHVEIYRQALGSQPGDVRTQLDVLARRTRLLADRVFDRGHALVRVHLTELRNPDVVVNLPEEVPQWAAEGLALGPPLAPAAPPPPGAPPLREESRPTQPRTSWLESVGTATGPTTAEMEAVIAAGDAPRLAQMADLLERGAETLRRVPDPPGDDGREDSARARLGILVRAEAARIAHAGGVVGMPALRDVARRVLAAAAPLT